MLPRSAWSSALRAFADSHDHCPRPDTDDGHTDDDCPGPDIDDDPAEDDHPDSSATHRSNTGSPHGTINEQPGPCVAEAVTATSSNRT